jgi:trigger factor
MNIAVEKQPKCLATLRAEIPADKVNQEREKLVRGFARQAKIPGFRPGKVPRKVIEKRFGEAIDDELQTNLVREAIKEALKQEELRVLDFRAPQSPTFHPDGTFSFHLDMVLAPEFDLPEYKGIEIEVPKAEVTDEMVEKNVEDLRERLAEFNDIEGRPAAEGDIAVVSYSSTLDGKPLEEAVGKPVGHLTGREDYWMLIDENSFLPGFATQLAGMSPGDKREITHTMPEDFPVADLRERDVVFNVELTGLKEKILPDLDDEFAAKIVPDSTMENLRIVIRESLAEELEKRIANHKVETLIQRLIGQTNFELPEEMLTNEIQGQADALVEQGVDSGMTEEQIAEQQSEIFNVAGQRANNSLRSNFILQKIAEAENIEVDDKELLEHLDKVAAQRKQPLKKLVGDLNKENRIPGIRNSLLVGKTIDFLVENAIIHEVDPPQEEEQAAVPAGADSAPANEETTTPPENNE